MRFYDEISEELIKVFHVGDISNLQIIKQISKGISGAEVYLIELHGTSLHQGIYYLKIDAEDEEFNTIQKEIAFRNAASCAQSQKIHDYFVMLIEIAGSSAINYISFYDIDELKIKKEAVEVIIPDLLENSIKKSESYILSEDYPSKIFNTQLKKKLDDKNILAQYLSGILRKNELRNAPVHMITGINFENGLLLPNAYAYATNDSLWEGIKVRNSVCCIHGDFHGNNVFYSRETKQYNMIDLALYREDGYLFFDVAYFELSLLLHSSVSMEMINWISLVRNLANKQWENVNCIDKEVFQTITKLENQWIERKNDSYHSYQDQLLEARIVARIMAGLNYAGKKKADKEVRKKSFFYACAFMELLLQIKKITSWKRNIADWREVNKNYNKDEIDSLRMEIDNFDDTQRYILVLGEHYDYSEDVLEALTRIHWSGIVSYRQTEKIEYYIKKDGLLNALTSAEQLHLITPDNMWCLYADGIDYDSDTIKSTYPKWRNRFGSFLDDWAKRLDHVIAPEELQFIIDLNSFSMDDHQKLDRLIESLDLIENACINVAVLTEGNNQIFNADDFDRLTFRYYNTTIDSLAEYCLRYLKGINEEDITIPSVSGARKVVSADDYNFIKNYVFLLHNRVLQMEGIVDEKEKRSFYFGKDILWQAIEEKLYVTRDEYETFKSKISEAVKEHNRFLLRVVHMPGAGASVLLRVLAWDFRNTYPTVVVDSMNKNIIECAHRLYSISGKHILLFLDGDFSENDIVQLVPQSRYYGIKTIIISLNRSYDKSPKDLSILSLDNAMAFHQRYGQEMEQSMRYTPEEIRARNENMKNLARDRSLAAYRLPFFFGINAFEEDYVSILDYMNGIMNHVKENVESTKVINYIALITYYTENDGLSVSYVKKLLKMKTRTSVRDILKKLNGDINNFVYYSSGSGFKICHSYVAKEILEKQYKMVSTDFKEFLELFIQDLCDCEGKKHTDRLNDLLMNLFIKRDILGDISNNLKKKNFSPIILALHDRYLQESFFQKLTEEIPNNAHFHQHYGRLIIYNNSDNLNTAKEQFDEAINLDPANPIHYHARGQMYTKYIINLCRNKYKESKILELFNAVSQFVETAVSDYEESARLIKESTDTTVDLSYPYASIIQIITYVVHQIYLKDMTKSEKDFLMLDNEVSKWCRAMVQKAEQYDMDTENRYDLLRENEFYSNIRRHLIKYQFTVEELEEKLLRSPNNLDLMKDYLYAVETKKERWENKSQQELECIIQYCREVIKGEDGKKEGILWRWFNASLNYKGADTVEMMAFLGTMDDADKNLTVQFMLYVIKLGLYLKSYDDKLLSDILDHIVLCKKLNRNSNRVSTRYYYSGTGPIGFCHEQEHGEIFEGTVTKWNSPQSGYLSLDHQPKLSAFFVPSVIGMHEEGAVGSKLDWKLGVSFDGIRAWTKLD